MQKYISAKQIIGYVHRKLNFGDILRVYDHPKGTPEEKLIWALRFSFNNFKDTMLYLNKINRKHLKYIKSLEIKDVDKEWVSIDIIFERPSAGIRILFSSSKNQTIARKFVMDVYGEYSIEEDIKDRWYLDKENRSDPEWRLVRLKAIIETEIVYNNNCRRMNIDELKDRIAYLLNSDLLTTDELHSCYKSKKIEKFRGAEFVTLDVFKKWCTELLNLKKISLFLTENKNNDYESIKSLISIFWDNFLFYYETKNEEAFAYEHIKADARKIASSYEEISYYEDELYNELEYLIEFCDRNKFMNHLRTLYKFINTETHTAAFM